MKKIKNTLIIDDDEVFVFLAKKLIENTDCVETVNTFNNGLDALIYLLKNENNLKELPEIIFLDLSMPIMNGWEFLDKFIKLIPNIGQEITIYICSASTSAADIIKAKSYAEISEYIIKPMTKDKLAGVICNFKKE